MERPPCSPASMRTRWPKSPVWANPFKQDLLVAGGSGRRDGVERCPRDVGGRRIHGGDAPGHFDAAAVALFAHGLPRGDVRRARQPQGSADVLVLGHEALSRGRGRRVRHQRHAARHPVLAERALGRAQGLRAEHALRSRQPEALAGAPASMAPSGEAARAMGPAPGARRGPASTRRSTPPTAPRPPLVLRAADLYVGRHIPSLRTSSFGRWRRGRRSEFGWLYSTPFGVSRRKTFHRAASR